jgi:hypothetical protein
MKPPNLKVNRLHPYPHTTFAFSRSCVWGQGLQTLTPNIWRPPHFKPEDNYDTPKNQDQPVSLMTRGWSFSTLHPKPTTQQNFTSYHRGPRARNLRRYSRTRAPTPNQQHVHHGSRIKPKHRRCQFNSNQQRHPKSITPEGALANPSHLGKCRTRAAPSWSLGGWNLR